MAESKEESQNKKLSKKVILSCLRSFPAMTDEELLSHVNRLVDKREPVEIVTIRDYKRELLKQKRAVEVIIPTDDVPPQFRRFHVFIETTFQRDVNGKDDPGYQQWVALEVQRRLIEGYSRFLISRGVAIYLGADWDMVLTVDAENTDKMHSFVTEQVRTCRHVLRTRTAWVYGVVGPLGLDPDKSAGGSGPSDEERADI